MRWYPCIGQLQSSDESRDEQPRVSSMRDWGVVTIVGGIGSRVGAGSREGGLRFFVRAELRGQIQIPPQELRVALWLSLLVGDSQRS